jgi:hypothetical protein
MLGWEYDSRVAAYQESDLEPSSDLGKMGTSG